jgi:hypothetical protein
MAGSVNKVIGLYVEDKKSIPQIAALMSYPRSRVRGILVHAGVEMRSRAEGVRLRRDVLGQHALGKTRHFTTAWKNNIRNARIKWADANARGTSVKPNGYVEFTRGPNKGRLVHVVLMEKRIGRHILPDECVHHIDGDRRNNSPDNLALLTRAGHTRLHRREDAIRKGVPK